MVDSISESIFGSKALKMKPEAVQTVCLFFIFKTSVYDVVCYFYQKSNHLSLFIGCRPIAAATVTSSRQFKVYFGLPPVSSVIVRSWKNVRFSFGSKNENHKYIFLLNSCPFGVMAVPSKTPTLALPAGIRVFATAKVKPRKPVT